MTLSVLVVSVGYTAKGSRQTGILADRLDISVAALSEDNEEKAQIILDAVRYVPKVAAALELVSDGDYLVRKPKAKPPDPELYMVRTWKRDKILPQASDARTVIVEELYAALDGHFRRLLVEIGSPGFAEHAPEKWADIVDSEARRIADQRIERLAVMDPLRAAYVRGQFRKKLGGSRKAYSPKVTKEAA